MTYAQLDERAERLAGHLRASGVGADVRVGICAERSIEMVVGLLGILKAGGAYVPLDPSYPKERIAFMLEDAQVRVLLTQEHLIDALPPHGAAVCLLDDESGWRAYDGVAVAPQASPSSLAYVIYTSGSTGKPKGVMVSHENVSNFFTAMDARVGGGEPGIWLALTSISFDISVLELFWTLARGFKVVVQREQGAVVAAGAARRRHGRWTSASSISPATTTRARRTSTGCSSKARSSPTGRASRPSGRRSATSTPSAASIRIPR